MTHTFISAGPRRRRSPETTELSGLFPIADWVIGHLDSIDTTRCPRELYSGAAEGRRDRLTLLCFSA